MQVSTKAIVVSKLRYKDYDLIVKCYTEQFGVKSYLIKNALKTRRGKFKPAYFQPLTIIDIEAEHKDNRSLHYLKDIKSKIILNPFILILLKAPSPCFFLRCLAMF